jgi:hypothetical protein
MPVAGGRRRDYDEEKTGANTTGIAPILKHEFLLMR